MAQFNLADYETVEERLKRFYTDNPDGRIITKNLTTPQDRQVNTWVMQAEVWLPSWSLPEASHKWVVADYTVSGWYLKATGIAFEIDGGSMANKTSALENAETSAIGRALANAGYSGNKRTSREEMAKVERGVTPAAPARNWATEIEALANVEDARQLYNEARTRKAGTAVLEAIKSKVASLGQPAS